MFRGIVVETARRGVVWIEQTDTHRSLFCHISKVIGLRVLHIDDIISFDIAANPRRPGQDMAVNVTYVGRP
jgi:cold shock CspA family protein